MAAHRSGSTPSTPIYRNRIVGHGDASPLELEPSPWNWRQHPALQKDAMAGALRELGWIQQIVVNQRTNHLVDGHLRLALALDAHETMVPVLYVDLSEAEERLALVSLDPLAAMANADREKLAALLQEVQSGESAVQAMLGDLAEMHGIDGELGRDETEDVRPDRFPHQPVVKMAVAVEHLAIVEEAIAATGERNRGEALLKICEVFLGTQDAAKGLHTSST